MAATVAFGQQLESYTFLGAVSPAGGILFSTPPPLTEYAKFTIVGDRLNVVSPAPVEIVFEPEGLSPLLLAYGERHRRSSLPAPIFGWNSWDNFGASVCEEDILTNLDFIRNHPVFGKKLTHVIVDDGWETGWGEWIPNGRFPNGMKALADRIHQAGFKAGIWLAPLVVEPDTRIYQHNSECLLRDLKGHPYLISHGNSRTFYALDVSVPKSQTFLREMFRRVREWGYDYVKLDFLFNQAQCFENGDAFAADSSWSSNRHTAEMLRIAREELGPDVHVLGCNYPFELGGDGVDEVRLTSDIGTFWENIDFVYQSHAVRFGLNRRWFAIDPDFTIVRVPHATWTEGSVPFHIERPWGRNEEDIGWRKGPYWSEEEMKLALTFVILSGGSVILGDHLPQLNANGLRYAEIALQYGGGCPARPLDLDGRRSLPCVFSNDQLLAFLNPFSTPLLLVVPEGFRVGKEIYTGTTLEGRELTLPPHTCSVYELDVHHS